jgi:hypothetical protein
MQLIWIILRHLFPRDPLRQGAEALRQRIAQLAHIAQDPATLGQLLIDPNLRLQLELLILDVEDCLRLWIAMRGCQIAKVRPKSPRRRCTPHLTHARDLNDLIARIRMVAAMFRNREKLARAHARKLKQLRDANPLGISDVALSSLAEGGGGGMRSMTEGAARSADLTSTRRPPHSIEGATP